VITVTSGRGQLIAGVDGTLDGVRDGSRGTLIASVGRHNHRPEATATALCRTPDVRLTP
jgi:hypothetical protein